VGSGSLFAYGILNPGYSYEMEKEDAIELARRAIFHAGHSDAYSGGTVNIYFIDENGWAKIDSQDVSCLYDKYM
ncbi:20S proteasome subunit beta 5, partial [Nematocida ausubeli]